MMPSNEQQNTEPTTTTTRKPARRLGESDFVGKRLEYLKEELPRYLAKRAADGKKKYRRGSGDSIWDTVCPGFWKRFGWRLPFGEEPPDDPEEAAAYARAPETPEEEQQMRDVVKWTEAKIKSWYSRKKTALGPAKLVFRPWLEKLRIHEGPAPRRLMDHQFYMQHNAYRNKVHNKCHARYPNVTRSSRLALLNKVAVECLQEETQDVKDAIKLGTDRQHAAELEEYNESLDGLPSVEEPHRAEARERFSAVVIPLLDGLRAYTGYHITLIAGRVRFADDGSATDALDVTSLHAGVGPDTPAQLDFTKSCPEEYDQFAKIFLRFVWNADHYKADDKADDAPPSLEASQGTTADSASAAATTTVPTMTSAASTSGRSATSNGDAPTSQTATSTTAPGTAAAAVTAPMTTVLPLGTAQGTTAGAAAASTTLTAISTTAQKNAPQCMAAIASTTTAPMNSENSGAMPAVSTPSIGADNANAADVSNVPNGTLTGASSESNAAATADHRMEEDEEEDEVAVEIRDLRESYLHQPGPLLTAYLKTLDLYSLRKEVGRTSWFPPERLEQEEQRLRNEATWRQVSSGSVATWGGADVAGGLKNGKGRKGKSRGKRARIEDEDDEYDQYNGPNTEADADGTPRETTRTRKPPAKRVRGSKAGSGNGAEEKGESNALRPTRLGSEWAAKAKEGMSQKEWGDAWDALLSAWHAQESLTLFYEPVMKRPSSVFATDLRPAAVHEWVSRARAQNYKPKISNVKEFGEKVRGWWAAINPSWRKSAEGKLERRGSGSWDSVNWPGPNGFWNSSYTHDCLKHMGRCPWHVTSNI